MTPAAPGVVRRVLGIDPGSRVTGWGVVERAGAAHERPRLVGCGTIRAPQDEPFPLRLARIHAGVRALLDEHAPDALVVEEAFGGKSVRSALRLGEARAVCVLAGALAARPVHELSPALVKKVVAGHGAAGKEAVRSAVLRAVSHAPARVPALDAADALALALAALLRLEAPAVLLGHAPIGRQAGQGRGRRWTLAHVEELARGGAGPGAARP